MYVSANQKDRDKHIPMVLLAYRVSPNATTGESPFYLLYGREPRLPIDAALILPDSKLSPSIAKLRTEIVHNFEEAQSIIKSNTELAQQKMKAYYDLKTTPVSYDIGSRVCLYTPKARKGLSKKLQLNYHGPYRIVAKLSRVHFKLRTVDNRPLSVTVHANRLKPYYDPADRPNEPPPHDPPPLEFLESDLPSDSFTTSHVPPLPTAGSDERQITRPEDDHPPQILRSVEPSP